MRIGNEPRLEIMRVFCGNLSLREIWSLPYLRGRHNSRSKLCFSPCCLRSLLVCAARVSRLKKAGIIDMVLWAK